MRKHVLQLGNQIGRANNKYRVFSNVRRLSAPLKNRFREKTSKANHSKIHGSGTFVQVAWVGMERNTERLKVRFAWARSRTALPQSTVPSRAKKQPMVQLPL